MGHDDGLADGRESPLLPTQRHVRLAIRNWPGGGKRYAQRFAEWLLTRSDDERELLTFMNSQRVAEVHVTGASTTLDLEMVRVTHIRSEPSHPAYGITWFGPPGTPPPTAGMPRYYFDGRPERVVEASKQHLRLLNELVEALQASGASE